ncbi:MAG: 50S ribosomal protein L3 [Calditrichales bacterium]|nr:MAG: 50S ribosomal protein L3 [Calditrichales bacterium]
MSGLLGKKIRMTQIFDESGRSIPVTVLNVGPCYVSQVKTAATDGYEAVQIAFQDMKEKHATKPRIGHLEKANLKPLKFLREFEMPEGDTKVGDALKVDMFGEGEKVVISGYAKGRGFQGVMKRHGFSGANKTHGQSDRWRAPGSIGQSSDPSRVLKNMKMAGRMGNNRVTVATVEVVKVDVERNLLFVKGPVPGSVNSLVEIKKNKNA